MAKNVHVLKDLDIGVVRAFGITPANVPEAVVTDEIATALEPQNVKLEELHIDRAYLSSRMVKECPFDLTIRLLGQCVTANAYQKCFYNGIGSRD